MIKRIFLGLALVAAIAGCSSVPLDNVPVEDKTAKNVAPGGGAQTNVAPVDATGADATANGPANDARLIYFDYDSYAVKPEFQSLLQAHAQFLKANGARHVALEGHTDERGGREYNLALGQRRAEAVRRALAVLGVSDNQMEAVSFGKEKPAATGSDESAWAQNRRVEITYR